jgi:Anti-sigma-K factor rskA
VTEDHGRIDELLAGHALRSLIGDDAEAAEHVLAEHVPSCPMCRETLRGFLDVAGEMALAPAPRRPPEVLLPQIRRELAEVPTGSGRRRFPMIAVAAGVAAVVGMAGLSAFLGVQVTRVRAESRLVQEALSFASLPEADQVALDDAGERQENPMTEIAVPGLERLYLVGRGIPQPSPGHVYVVWFASAGRFQRVGQFVPDPGESLTVLRLTVDAARYDQVLITEEVAGATPDAPSDRWQWSARL